jgi:hypothetical protein
VTNDYNVDGDASNGGQKLLGIRRGGYNLQAGIVTQSIRQELRVYARAVGNDDTHKVRGHFIMGGHSISPDISVS